LVEARVLVPISAKIPEQMYKELVRRAESEGVTVSALVRRAIGNYLGMPVEQPLEAKLRELEELKAKIAKLSDLEARVAKLEELLASKSTASKAESPSGSSKSSSKSTKSGTRVYCKAKSEIKNVGSYVRKLQSEGRLVDWWDEGGKYCFEVREG